MQARLKSFTFKTFLTSNEGRSLSNELAVILIDDHLARYKDIHTVVDVLERRCGTFCSASTVFIHYAMQHIKAAPAGSEALHESFRLLKRAAGQIPHEKMEQIAHDYVGQGCLPQAVELALLCARARDPKNATNAMITGDDSVAPLFKAKQPFYDCIYQLLKHAIVPNMEASRCTS